jgi:hypothetical protein
MKLRFQADADFNHKVILGLRRREPAVDFQDAHMGGVIGVPDPEVLRKASDLGRVLISHDRQTMPAHFARLLESRSSPGLVIVPQELEIGAIIEELLLMWAASEAEEWRDKVAYLPL